MPLPSSGAIPRRPTIATTGPRARPAPREENEADRTTSGTLTDEAYARLEERIATLALAPGALVSEQALVKSIGLGRTPIREALQRLQREGLVIVLPRKGIRITDTDPKRQLLVLEVRRELERLLCRAAAERATSAERRRFTEIAEEMDATRASNDDIAFMRLDRELNQLLIQAAHNEFAAGAMRLLSGLSRRFWYEHYKLAADLPLCAALHAEEARAVAAADAKRAAAASDRLMDYVAAFTRLAAER